LYSIVFNDTISHWTNCAFGLYPSPSSESYRNYYQSCYTNSNQMWKWAEFMYGVLERIGEETVRSHCLLYCDVTSLHGVTTQRTATWIFTVVKTPILEAVFCFNVSFWRRSSKSTE